MKIAMAVAVFFFASFSTFAQIQRKSADAGKVRETGKNIESNNNESVSKKKDQLKIIKELNLTREQKGKLKEMRQVNDAKKAAIMNDESLSEAQKQVEINAIKRSGMADLQGILTESQKVKMKELRKDRKGAKGAAIMEE